MNLIMIYDFYQVEWKLKKSIYMILIYMILIYMIKFNQNGWLKTYIDMHTKLRQKAKNNLRKIFQANE